jgi:hypothetical protein
MDGDAPAVCSSPHATTVAEGDHVFRVAVIDASGAVDPTPAFYTFAVDLTAPETDLRGGPAPASGGNPEFAFTSPDESATFECRLDASPFAACMSPRVEAVASAGVHTFLIRAVDAAGNPDLTPASNTFTVEPTPVSAFSDSSTILCSDGASAIPCPTQFGLAYGQDGNFLHRPEYIATADTVVDATSGLMWERSNAEVAPWDTQVARCAGLAAGGFTDWRMPTRLEMLTVIDAGRTAPALDTSVFLDAQPGFYWLGQELDGVPSSAWFFGGSDANLSWNGKDAFCSAKCVRGATASGTLTLSGSGLSVYDSRTGSRWQGTPSETTFTWMDALSYCNDLVLDGLSDWRLPSVKELQSLIDVGSGRNPVEIAPVFPGQDAVEMWTSSPYPSAPSQSYTVEMLTGAGSTKPTGTLLQTRCVH